MICDRHTDTTVEYGTAECPLCVALSKRMNRYRVQQDAQGQARTTIPVMYFDHSETRTTPPFDPKRDA